MLTMYANLVVGWILTAPFALRGGLDPVRANFWKIFAMAIVAAFERNLTNSSMHFIGGGLKTALHSFNVVLTFLAAALLGADPRGRKCLLGGCCSKELRSNWLLIPALTLVTAGGLVTAMWGEKSLDGNFLGILFQLCSGVCYALKFAIAKLLFPGVRHGTTSSNVPKPSKFQVAFISNPITGLTALGCVPFFERSWEAPPIESIFAVGAGATGILLFELQLAELTSALTVSVLAVVHNVVIVLFFLIFFGEEMDGAKLTGFAVSTAGAVIYAFAKRRQANEEAAPPVASAEEGMSMKTTLVESSDAPVGQRRGPSFTEGADAEHRAEAPNSARRRELDRSEPARESQVPL